MKQKKHHHGLNAIYVPVVMVAALCVWAFALPVALAIIAVATVVAFAAVIL